MLLLCVFHNKNLRYTIAKALDLHFCLSTSFIFRNSQWYNNMSVLWWETSRGLMFTLYRSSPKLYSCLGKIKPYITVQKRFILITITVLYKICIELGSVSFIWKIYDTFIKALLGMAATNTVMYFSYLVSLADRLLIRRTLVHYINLIISWLFVN